MADNWLEKHQEEYEKRKAAWQKRRRKPIRTVTPKDNQSENH